MNRLIEHHLLFLKATTRSASEQMNELAALAGKVVQPLMILANVEIGRNGFHRADVVNMTWAELHCTFTGLHDQLGRAKRRWVVLNPAAQLS